MSKNYAFIIYCLFLVSSCSKHNHDTSARSSKMMQAQLVEAKHFDVPVPLGFTLAHKSSTKQDSDFSDFMRYSGSLAVEDAITFYKREMERSGWEISDLSSNQEGFLYCSKPTKLCGIQIRPDRNTPTNHASTISLFITQKSS